MNTNSSVGVPIAIVGASIAAVSIGVRIYLKRRCPCQHAPQHVAPAAVVEPVPAAIPQQMDTGFPYGTPLDAQQPVTGQVVAPDEVTVTERGIPLVLR